MASIRNREDAGRKLKELLIENNQSFDVCIGLNEGGVVVSEKIAEAFNRPVNLLKVASFGLPSAPTMDLGSVTDEGTLSINPEVEKAVNVKPSYVASVAEEKRFNARKEYYSYCNGLERPDLSGKSVFIVDDGSQPISALTAAIGYAKKSGSENIILGASFISEACLARLSRLADSTVFINSAKSVGGVSDFYERPERLEKDFVKDILMR